MGYRSGRYKISAKAWKKLAAAESEAGISGTPISYSESGRKESLLHEDAGEYLPGKPLPPWWSKLPADASELERVLPEIHARLRLAAILRHEADTHSVTLSSIHRSPLHAAFSELGLDGTGFTFLQGFTVLTDAYCSELANLRVTKIKMEMEASKFAMDSLFGRVLQSLGIEKASTTTRERQIAEQVLEKIRSDSSKEKKE